VKQNLNDRETAGDGNAGKVELSPGNFMKTRQLKVQFLSTARPKVWLFLPCGEGRYIAVPDNREARYPAPRVQKTARATPAVVSALKTRPAAPARSRSRTA
jgi:hypothetical protein